MMQKQMDKVGHICICITNCSV